MSGGSTSSLHSFCMATERAPIWRNTSLSGACSSADSVANVLGCEDDRLGVRQKFASISVAMFVDSVASLWRLHSETQDLPPIMLWKTKGDVKEYDGEGGSFGKRYELRLPRDRVSRPHSTLSSCPMQFHAALEKLKYRCMPTLYRTHNRIRSPRLTTVWVREVGRIDP